MSKIQSVLSDEESMKQIKELADMLSAPQSGENQDVNSNTNNNVNTQALPQNNSNNNLGNLDLNSLFSTLSQNLNSNNNTSSNNNSAKVSNDSNNNIDFSSILSGLSGMASNSNTATQNSNNGSGGGLGIDLSTIMKLQGLMQNVKQDKNAELLIALKPLLNNQRQEKVDKAVKLLKLWTVYSVAKEQGLLNLSGLL